MKQGKTTTSVAIVIPAFNEARTIALVAERACLHASKVIVVDDASTDDTVASLSGIPVDVVRHERNQGKAAALWSGIQEAARWGATAVVTLDGDGQHNPGDIPALLSAHSKSPDDIVIAARREGREKAPMLRKTANHIADFWIGWAAGRRIYDSQSGFRLYPMSLFGSVSVPAFGGRNFVFESEILIEAAWFGFDCVAVPIRSVYPPGSRASHYKPYEDTSAIVKMVAGRLLRKGMYPVGLYRSLVGRIRWA